VYGDQPQGGELSKEVVSGDRRKVLWLCCGEEGGIVGRSENLVSIDVQRRDSRPKLVKGNGIQHCTREPGNVGTNLQERYPCCTDV
jgi:hypothetical protein